MVLQASQVHPAVKYTLAALGSLHESLEIAYTTWLDDRARPAHIFSLQQYNKAVSILTTKDSSIPLEVLLISCVLFVCYETLQRNYGTAVKILQSGCDVLDRWQKSEGKDPAFLTINSASDAIRNDIAPVLNRARVQASTFITLAASSLFPKAQAADVNVYIPEAFSSLHHARTCFDSIMEQIYNSMHPVECQPDHQLVPSLVIRFQTILDDWYAKTTVLLDQNIHQQDHNFMRGALFLKLHYRVACIVLHTISYADEMLFDNHVQDFEAIVTLSAEFLKFSNGDSKYDNPKCLPLTKLSFGFDLGIVAALFLTALHCRDPFIRRGAIGILNSGHRREGAWDSYAGAKIARYIMGIEEQGLKHVRSCADVPESSRVKLLNGDDKCLGPGGSTPLGKDERLARIRGKCL